MLLWALAAELLLLAIFLYVPPVAALLGQHGPALIGVLVALLGPVAVLSADSGEKLLTGSRDEQLNTVETTGVMSGTAVGRSAPRNR
jgi:hypothetical protein